MIRFANSVRIARSASDVYAFLADPRNLSLWNHHVLDVRAVTRDRRRDEEDFDVIRKTDRQVWHVAHRRTQQEVVFETVHGKPHVMMRFTVLPDAKGALVRDEWTVETSLGRLAERVLGMKMKAAVRENLTLMRELLETSKVTLQDGRVTAAPRPFAPSTRHRGT